jgi:hypothetical protein
MREKVKQEKELPLPEDTPTSTAILSPISEALLAML